MIKYKLTLKRLNKNNHFRWFLTYEIKGNETEIKLYFKFKSKEPVLAMDFSRARVVSLEEAKDMAQMYIKAEDFYNGHKLVWIERIVSYGEY